MTIRKGCRRYADTDMVKQAIGSTQLHKIIVYKGMEMRVCEELA